MPHLINSMMYVGQEPWHGLGARFPGNSTYEEIVQAAGFYEVEEREVVFLPDLTTAEDKKALVRADDGRYLSIVGKGYRVVQFRDVARTLVEAAGMFGGFFHTAGTLGPVGIRGWMLGELPGEITVKGDPSPVKKYLLGCTGHDGLTSVVLKNVATRVVCANTLGVALGEQGGAEFRLRHTTNASARLTEAAAAIRKLLVSYDRFGELANQLAVTRFTDGQMRATLDSVMPIPEDDRDHVRLEAGRDRVLSLFETASGLNAEIRGTAWAAFQAWTEYADHHRPTRVAKTPTGTERLESLWMGNAAKLKQQALAAITYETGIGLLAA